MIESKQEFTTIVVDLETNCFNRYRVRMRCCQLAWQLHTVDGELLNKGNYYIKPDNWIVTQEAADLHKITTERAEKEGVPIKEALTVFVKDLMRAHVWCGHGLHGVDMPVIKHELKDCGFDDAIIHIEKRLHVFCSMKQTTDIVRLPNKRKGYPGWKWPSLSELYFFLFKEPLNQAHDAAVDTAATAKCYFKLQQLARDAKVKNSSPESRPQTPAAAASHTP